MNKKKILKFMNILYTLVSIPAFVISVLGVLFFLAFAGDDPFLFEKYDKTLELFVISVLLIPINIILANIFSWRSYFKNRFLESYIWMFVPIIYFVAFWILNS